MTEHDRRGLILTAATRLFRHYGHTKTTMADIARDAGVGIGTLYLDFPSKDAIIRELSTKTHFRVLDAMKASLEGKHGFSERFFALMQARTMSLVELSASGGHACELLHCKSDSVRHAQDFFRLAEAEILCEMLDAARASKEIDVDDSKQTAALIQRACACLTPPWIFGVPRTEAVTLTWQLTHLLLHGLIRRENAPRRISYEAVKKKAPRRPR